MVIPFFQTVETCLACETVLTPCKFSKNDSKNLGSELSGSERPALIRLRCSRRLDKVPAKGLHNLRMGSTLTQVPGTNP